MNNSLVLGDLGSLTGINEGFYEKKLSSFSYSLDFNSIYATIFDHSKQLKGEIESFINCFDVCFLTTIDFLV